MTQWSSSASGSLILQCIRIIVGHVGFEPWNSAPEVKSGARPNELPSVVCTWENIDDGPIGEAEMVEDLTEQADSPQVQQLILLPDILPSCTTTINISNIMDDHAILTKQRYDKVRKIRNTGQNIR